MGDLRGDAHCAGCIYLGYAGGGITCCDYIFKVGKCRPCPPGKDCTVKETQRRQQKATKKKAYAVTKECLWCGKAFEQKDYHAQKYCCPMCKSAAAVYRKKCRKEEMKVGDQ